MSRRTQYAPGVPCWVESLHPDPLAARSFYADLFEWAFDDPAPLTGRCVARRHGRLVAALEPAPGTLANAVWLTHVSVAELERSLELALAAGAAILAPVRERGAAGRAAVIADPEGVALALWEAGSCAAAEVRDEPGAWWMSALHTAQPETAAAF